MMYKVSQAFAHLASTQKLFRFSDFTQKLSGIGFALMTETLPQNHMPRSVSMTSAGFCLPSLGWYSCCWRCCPGPLNQSGWDSGAAKWWPGPQLMKHHMTLMLDKTTPFFCLQLYTGIWNNYIIVENWGFSQLNNWRKNSWWSSWSQQCAGAKVWQLGLSCLQQQLLWSTSGTIDQPR